MAKVIYEYTPPARAEDPRPSVALRCALCKGITWAYADQVWTKCARCGVRLVNRAGTWTEGIECNPED